MTHAAIPDRPGFHLVEPSAWPIIGAGFALLSAFGLILFMHGASLGPALLTIGVAGILFTMAGWWRDVVLEAQGGYHNVIVRHGLTIGMILFIASEVMFFVAWFWAFFWSAVNPGDTQVVGRLDFTGGLWPPKGTDVLDSLKLPLMNTLVLLTSSAAVNVAHDELREGDQVMVKVLALEGNRIKLSRKAVLREQRAKLGLPEVPEGQQQGGRERGGDRPVRVGENCAAEGQHRL